MELWLVFMVGVYDHDVHYIAASEEDAKRFTKEYAPDCDGYHLWEIRKMTLGVPSSEAIKKGGPIWEELDRIRAEKPQWGTDGYKRSQHLIFHLRHGEVVCRCDEEWAELQRLDGQEKETLDELSDSWRVMQCDTCLASLCWDKNDIQGYDMSSWAEALHWAISEVDHNLFEHEVRSSL